VDDQHHQTILVARQGGAVTVTLNRPEKKNAVNATMWNELGDVLDEVGRSSGDRVLVLRGAGGSFCSGADMSSAPSELNPLTAMERIQGIALTLHQLPKPTVAWVDGDAVGAGCNLALGCDIVLATPRSRFAEIFVRRALSVDFGGSWILPRLVGLHRAKLLCLTGNLISAEEAAAMNLITEVVEETLIEARMKALVDDLVAGPPVAQALIKKLLNAGATSSLTEALQAESIAQAVNVLSPDSGKYRTSFMKR
jgi:enoyl-CoA hydratase/carnithine racemase